MVDLAPNSSKARDMSAEQLVAEFAERERSRDERDVDKTEREFSIGTRDFPSGMTMVLSQVSRSTRELPAVLTKCFSHSVVDWYRSLPDVGELEDLHKQVSDLCSDRGYVDLQEEVDNLDKYRFRISQSVSTMTGTTTIKTIAWVNSHLLDMSHWVGATPARLLCVGICRCLCLNRKGWGEQTLDNFLEPEVNHFLWYLRERRLTLQHYFDVASIRVKRDSGKQNSVLFSRKLGNGAY